MTTENNWLNAEGLARVWLMSRGIIPGSVIKNNDGLVGQPAEPSKKSGEKTPVEVLQSEIMTFKEFQRKIETREGLHIDPQRKDEIEANLVIVHAAIGKKILEFEKAINALNYYTLPDI